MDPSKIEELKEKSFERLLSPKTLNVNPKKVPEFSKICPFSPSIGRPKSAKTLERLKTPFAERL